jgi:hypothetical protein
MLSNDSSIFSNTSIFSSDNIGLLYQGVLFIPPQKGLAFFCSGILDIPNISLI